MLRDLWGQGVKRTVEYFVFHDESEPNKRWLLIGLLLVRKEHLDAVRAVLQNCRSKERYWGELHAAIFDTYGDLGSIDLFETVYEEYPAYARRSRIKKNKRRQ